MKKRTKIILGIFGILLVVISITTFYIIKKHNPVSNIDSQKTNENTYPYVNTLPEGEAILHPK